jgi:hypothetical protein
MKICTKCGKEKNLDQFTTGLRPWCKECVREYNSKYRNTHKEEKKKKDKGYREKNREKINKQHKEYYKNNKKEFQRKSRLNRINNKEKIKEQRRKSRERNREKIKQQKIAYYQKNRNRIIQKAVDNRKKLRINNPSRKALDSCRVRIRQFIKTLNLQTDEKFMKLSSTSELLGCSRMELKNYLESKFKPGMTWDNYGINGWHIDHIKPCASFSNFNNIETQKECFNYKNLQPLWAYENRSKSSKFEES